jgi:hypothetical protein
VFPLECKVAVALGWDWTPQRLLVETLNTVTWRLKAAICRSAGRGFTENFPVATWKAPLLDSEVLDHVSTATNTIDVAVRCIQSHVIPRQRIQKRLPSHGNEPPKHSNGKERENSTVEGGDLHTVLPEPTSGRELTNIRQTEEVRSEVFILCGVVTVTFRVLSLSVVTKCYSYSKIVVPPGEYPLNRFLWSWTH